MKKSLILLALLSANAFAQSTHLVLHGASTHTRQHPRMEWNERNGGIGVRHQVSPDWGVQAGVFRNSFYNTSVYGLVQYTPLHIGPVSLGGFGGFATGYPDQAVAGGAMAIIQHKRLSLVVRAIPKAYAYTGAASVEIGIQF